MKLEKLYKRTSTGNIQQWEIEVVENRFRTISGKLDGKLVVSNWTECFGKNVGKSNETTPEEQALSEARSKFQKQLDKGYKKDTEDIDNAKYIKPMLAKDYYQYENKIEYPVYIQPKLDGIRCIATKDGLFTRNGKPIIACPHVFDVVKEFIEVYELEALDGELYNNKYSDNFNEIVSIVKKTKPTEEDILKSKENIQYWVYDCVSQGNFIERNNIIQGLYGLTGIVVVDTRECNSKEEIFLNHNEFIGEGKEGSIVRENVVYAKKRTKSLLKIKSFKDEEFLVKDVIEGIGNRNGVAGSIVCQLSDGREFHSNIKGDFTFLENLLKNKSEYIGNTCTVKFQDYTPDGIPRFPHAIKFNRENYE